MAFGARIQRVKKERRFQDRKKLPPELLYNEFFADTGLPLPVVRKALEEVAGNCGVSIGYLRPDDRFAEELRPVSRLDSIDYLLDVELDLMSWGVEAAEMNKINTVRDYVVVAGKYRKRKEA